MRYTGEHAYGYKVSLWRSGKCLFGLMSRAEGLIWDTTTFDFNGKLAGPRLRGAFTHAQTNHPESPARVEQVQLRRQPRPDETLGLKTYGDWLALYGPMLKRLGPN